MYESDEELKAFFESLFDFKMVRKLGAGAFGLAVLAFHETEGIHKVFKFPRDEKTTEALKVEGANLVKLRNLLHPNIIQLHQYGKAVINWNARKEERYYLCLAYGGRSLRGELGELRVEYDREGNALYSGSGKRLPLERALRIAIEVCEGLEAAHGFKDSDIRIVHRDIKPDNILIDEEYGTARIADFGISRVIDRSTGIASVAGTLLYMDPECFQGKAGIFSDIYSFGVVMYEMLTGELPFPNFPDRLLRPARDPRELNPEIPEELSRVILNALKNDRRERYPNATEMLADLKKVSALLNPLPERYTKIETLAANRFLCEDAEAHQRVVVHIAECDIPTSDLAREAAMLEDVSNPAMVLPLRHFSNEQIVGIVFPAPRGRPLTAALGEAPMKDENALQQMCRLMADVCDVVAGANNAGAVHGFLSPNLLYCDGKNVTVHGFGSAPLLRARKSGNLREENFLAAFRDSLPFMSPQILEGKSDPTAADDVFSIGAAMYSLLVGEPHIQKDVLESIVRGAAVPQSLKDPRDANPIIPRRLASIVAKSLQWNVNDRYETPRDMAAALRECRWPDDIIETMAQDALGKYEAGDVLAAYDLLEHALVVDPGNGYVHYTRGVIYAREREYKWAVEELQAAAGVEPGRDVFAQLGRCFMEWGAQYEQAEQAFRRALEYGDDAEIHALLARALKSQGKTDEAAREMQRAIELETDSSMRERRKFQLPSWRGKPESDTDSKG